MSERQTEAKGETSISKEAISLEEKIGMAKKFDREMKDYAKATVKEFLGIYGYEEDVDINMEESEMSKTGKTSANENTRQAQKLEETDSGSSTVSTMTSTFEIEKATGSDCPVSSVSISSSTTSGNADLTRFCITMSIPRPGADSLEGYTTLRFWNCIMCSTAFVGTKPEIIQRVHHPQLFTYQPEWLSHAGICNRCQKTLTLQAPKITIYAISESSQHHNGHSGATTSVPGVSTPGVSTVGDSFPRSSIAHAPGTFVPRAYITGTSVPVVMCNELPGQCNCAHAACTQ